MQILDFGTTQKGQKTKLYKLKNEKLECWVTDYGSTLVKLLVPDAQGEKRDIVLGFEDVSGYETDDASVGCNVGRCANRIAGGIFVLHKKTYHLDINLAGNTLHSGFDRYANRMWTVEEYSDTKITFSLESPHLDQGFPGALKISVTYELLDNELGIVYHGIPDQDTIINLTNHSYFQLDGEGNGSILSHRVRLCAEYFTPVDETGIPIGEKRLVAGTPMDFRKAHAIGESVDAEDEQIRIGAGYDHNYCIDDYDGTLKTAVELSSEESGIRMKIRTDYPGVQMYTANFLNVGKGKQGHAYHAREAVCFEPQYFPDAIHRSEFVSPVQKGGEQFRKEIRYDFSVLRNDNLL